MNGIKAGTMMNRINMSVDSLFVTIINIEAGEPEDDPFEDAACTHRNEMNDLTIVEKFNR